MTLGEAVEQFLTWCGERRARATCRLYGSRLRSLVAEHGAKNLVGISREMVESWLIASGRRADGRSKAPDTRRSTAQAFEQFQKWAIDYGHLANPVVAKLPKPAGRRRTRIPTPEETQRLLENATPEFRRVYQALRQSGARPNEICRATIADWKRPQQVIILEEHKTAEKTGEVRRIAVGARMEQLLLEAVGDRTDGPIFLSPTGRPWTPQRLSTIYCQLRKKAGLARDLVLYLARHEHGTVITKKLGIYPAKEALGHKSITTTQRYAHTTNAELASNQDAFLP
jgi:integrase